MKKPRLSVTVWLLFVSLLLHAGAAWSKVDVTGRPMETVTGFSYTAGPDESPETARALARYGAKQKAVVTTAGRLIDAGLLNKETSRQMAVFCLVADTMPFSLIEESIDVASRTYTVKIKSSLSLSDYVKAEIRNEALEKEELHLSLKEEMEPEVAASIAPAFELSRAYRYISNRHWRMAIIYIDHIETKYPRWGALHLAKARAYLGMHERERAISALKSACYLGVQEACLKINALDPPD